MGLLSSDGETDVSRPTLQKLLDALRVHRFGEDARVHLAPLRYRSIDQLDTDVAAAAMQKVRELSEALSRSYAPATEGGSMRQMLFDEALADLAGISRASLRRYATSERTTPQPVAERLHWIATVTADLAGSYNEFGIRRWFDRPRQQLKGASPRQFLEGSWTPNSTEALRIKELSTAVV